MKITSLDIGTNSIGWSLVDAKKQVLMAMGTRIFPIGVNEDAYNKNHKEESKNLTRRTARGTRRRLFRFKMKRQRLEVLLHKYLKIVPQRDQNSIQVYEWRAKGLDHLLTPEQLATVLTHLNRRRGFLSNAKDEIAIEGDADLGIAADKDAGKVKTAIENLQNILKENHCRTMGEYFYKLIAQNAQSHDTQAPALRIRERYTSRAAYIEEFNMIWNKQASLYAQKADYPELNEEAKLEIGEKCIFYQRPLKSAKHLINNCRFEPTEKCSTLSGWAAQEFRIWQKINDLEFESETNEGNEWLKLDEKQRQQANDFFQTHGKFKLSELKKHLFGKQKINANFKDADFLVGNITKIKISVAVGEKRAKLMNDKQFAALWHIIYQAHQKGKIAETRAELKKYALTKLKMTEDEAKVFIKINFEDGYTSLSKKAIDKILPFLKQGNIYSKACQLAGYNHSEKENIYSPDNKKVPPLKPNELRNPIVQRSLTETIRLVNEIIEKYGKPDVIRIETAKELSKPKKAREEMYKQISAKHAQRVDYCKFLAEKGLITDEHFSPRNPLIAKYELWLELQPDTYGLKQSGKSDEEIKDFLAFSKKVNYKDVERYRLWLECNRISVYTGKIISLSALFSPEIQIEHIVPYSKGMNDTFGNKTLCEVKFNKEKSNRTPYEYIFNELGKDQWKFFCIRAKELPKHKYEKLIAKEYPNDDFSEQQLRNTAYIAVEAAKRLQAICPDVQTTKGQATAFLRRIWGLNPLLNTDNVDIKNRGDHRHHAVDAVVIALTDKRLMQLVSSNTYFDDKGRQRVYPLSKDEYPELTEKMWNGNLRKQVQEKLDELLVSHRADHSIVYKKRGRIVLKNGKTTRTKPTNAVRGALHKETYYGKITFPYEKHPTFIKGEEIYVVRGKLSEITEKNIDYIVNPVIIEVLKNRIAQHGNDYKKAFVDPIFMPKQQGKEHIQVPIKKIRFGEYISKPISLHTRKNLNEKIFVKSEENYVMGIYENEDGTKRNSIIVSLFEAVQKKNNQEMMLPIKDQKGYTLKYTLKKGEMFVLYDEHPDEINWINKDIFHRLYKVAKISGKQIYLDWHHIADTTSPVLNKDIKPIARVERGVGRFKGIKVNVSILGEITVAKRQ